MRKILRRLDRQLYLRGLRSIERLTFPSFLGLGTGQSGTTWLSNHLSRHPRVHVPPQKELHYFDQHYREWSVGYYASFFAKHPGIVCGEITPGYSILNRERIATVHELCPDVRLILIIRNPIERSWSGLRRVVARLGRTMDEIGQAKLIELLDKEWTYEGTDVQGPRGDYEPGLLEGHYSRAIDNWLSVYREDQLLITFFDELKTNPHAFLARVCQHIGVDDSFFAGSTGLSNPVNSNPAVPMPSQVRRFLSEKYADEIRELQRRYGSPVDTWVSTLGASAKG